MSDSGRVMGECGHGHYYNCQQCRAERAEAERDRYRTAAERLSYAVEQALGPVLFGTQEEKHPETGEVHQMPLWGEHTAETLAELAAKKLLEWKHRAWESVLNNHRLREKLDALEMQLEEAQTMPQRDEDTGIQVILNVPIREPRHQSDGRYSWMRAPEGTNFLPAAIFDLLPGLKQGSVCAFYGTAEEALDALVAACKAFQERQEVKSNDQQ